MSMYFSITNCYVVFRTVCWMLIDLRLCYFVLIVMTVYVQKFVIHHTLSVI